MTPHLPPTNSPAQAVSSLEHEGQPPGLEVRQLICSEIMSKVKPSLCRCCWQVNGQVDGVQEEEVTMDVIETQLCQHSANSQQQTVVR
jgi:hypothetical protein